jgi:fibronectin-binding autotransporter adhesin
MLSNELCYRSLHPRPAGSFRENWLCVLFVAMLSSANAQSTFITTSGAQQWGTTGNWSPSGVPSAVDASVIFNSPTGGNQTVSLSPSGTNVRTVGSITITNDSTNTFTLNNGTGGSLIMDSTLGNTSLTVNGTGNVVNTISATTALNDTLEVIVNNTATTSASGAITLTGAISGLGGLIKKGAGTLSLTTTAKTYTGATSVEAGVLRVSEASQPTGTSSVTVSAGAQFRTDSNENRAWSFGSGTVTLNGLGTSGSAGAFRQQGTMASSEIQTYMNNFNLATTSGIHVDGGNGRAQFIGNLSGSGDLVKTGAGRLQLSGVNAAYTGGTQIQNGSILVDSTSRLGSGNLAFTQSAGNNPSITFNNASQTVGNLSSAWTDSSGTQTQTLTLNGTALTINQASDATFGTGVVATLTSIIAGTGSITKAGAANLTLSSANTYTGGTTVSAGTLVLNNSSGSGTGTGAVTIASSGTLAGTGRIAPAADTNINLNGSVYVGDTTLASPVASIMELATFGTGSTISSSSAIFYFDLFSGAGSERLNALTTADHIKLPGRLANHSSGTLVIGNPLTMRGFKVGDAWNLFNLTGGSSIANDFNLDYSDLNLDPDVLAGQFDRSTGTFYIAHVIPEPSRALLFILGLATLCLQRRREPVTDP